MLPSLPLKKKKELLFTMAPFFSLPCVWRVDLNFSHVSVPQPLAFYISSLARLPDPYFTKTNTLSSFHSTFPLPLILFTALAFYSYFPYTILLLPSYTCLMVSSWTVFFCPLKTEDGKLAPSLCLWGSYVCSHSLNYDQCAGHSICIPPYSWWLPYAWHSFLKCCLHTCTLS